MCFLTTKEIENLIENGNIKEGVKSKITHNESGKILSYGVDGSGYTCRLGEIFSSYKSHNSYNTVSPNSYYPRRNGRTHWFLVSKEQRIIRFYEELNLPNNIGGLIFPKSSYSRYGLFYSTAVIEPGYKGTIDISICNLSNETTLLYLGEGIAQIMFYIADGAKEYVGNQQQYNQL